MSTLSNIQDFLGKYDDQDGSRNWRRLEKDFIGVTELITGDQSLNMNDVGEMLDISFRQEIDLKTVEESLFDLADEYASDDDESDESVDDFEDDYEYEDDDEYGYEFDSEYDNGYGYGYDDEGDSGGFDEDIELFVEKYDDLDGSRDWRRLEKDIIGVTQLINGDQNLTMKGVSELFNISFKQRIDLEQIEESLYELAEGFSSSEDDYDYDDEDDYGYDDEDDYEDASGDFDKDIEMFVEKYDDMDGSRNWRRLEKDLIGVTQLINGDQNLTMKGVSELFDISFKQRIDLESIEESLYELAEGFSSSEDDYGYDYDDDYSYDDDDDYSYDDEDGYGHKDDDKRDVFTDQDDAEFSVSSSDVEDRLISIQLNFELGALVPSKKKFAVKSNGKKQKITAVETFPEDGIVTLAMKKSLAGSNDILISYRDLKGDQKRGVIENISGEDLPSFKNLVPEITSDDETPPSLIDAYIDEKQLYLEFDEILEKDSLKKSTLKVSQGKKRVLVASGETYIDDVIAVYELKNNVSEGVSLTLDYRDPRGDQGSGVIQDQNGNDLLTISGYEILA